MGKMKQKGGKNNLNNRNKNVKRIKTITGKIDAAASGCAFIPDPCGGKDFYISQNNLFGALNGDTVEAAVFSDNTAKVISVLARGSKFIAGYFQKAGDSAVVLSKNKKFPDVLLKNFAAGKDSPQNGDLLIIKTDDFNIVKNLKSGAEAELMSLVYSYGYESDFPPTVKREAKAVCRILPDDYAGRTDFRRDVVFTIDGEDSRDFDDAVSVKKTDRGYTLSVHIADVSHYVTGGSVIDKEAYRRGTSVYFPYAVIPMLPTELSNDICSLNEGEDRLTLTVTADISPRGAVTDYKICESVINSAARLTYANAELIINGKDNPEKKRDNYQKIEQSLKIMAELANILIKKRISRGAVEFSNFESDISMDGFTVNDIRRKEQLFSHRLIEEFMILANILVAKSMEKNQPFVYRVHTPPSPEKLLRLKSFLDSVGLSFDFDEEVTPKEVTAFLSTVPKNLYDVVSMVTLRAMSKAAYEPVCRGHFGLSLSHYCHFTSPIRRYPDLLIHRILKDKLKGNPIKKYRAFAEEACVQSSLTERKAEEAERKADDYLKAQFMSKHIGESYVGTISGVTSWGVFVMLQNTAEGILRVEKLNGRYDFDEPSYTLRGERIFKLGDSLTVKILSVFEDRIELTLVD